MGAMATTTADHRDDGAWFGAVSHRFFLRGWPHCWFLFSCASSHLGQTLRDVRKNAFEKRFTGGNSVDYFAVKGICLLLRCWGASGLRGIHAGGIKVSSGVWMAYRATLEDVAAVARGVCDDGFAGAE